MSPNPALFGVAALALVVALAFVAMASDVRRGLVAVAAASVAVASLYAQLGAYEAMAAQAIFFGAGALAFFVVARSMRVAATVARAPAVRPLRAAVVSVLVMAALAKVQLGDGASSVAGPLAGAPAPEPSPALVAPLPSTPAPTFARYLIPLGLAAVVVFAGLVGSPAMPKLRGATPSRGSGGTP